MYDYSLVGEIISNKEKVKIVCQEHGVFEQSVNNHMNNLQGCPDCKIMSKGENKISKILKTKNISYIREYKFDDCVYNNQKLRFDFYLPEYNICIEYDGRQHYEAIKYYGSEELFKIRRKRDEIKNKYCFKNNIYLIRIPYYCFSEIENIIKKELN